MVNQSMNPMQLLQQLKSGNAKGVASYIIQNNFRNNPEMQNLLALGQKGDVQTLQKIAQQQLSAQGIDVQTALNSLLKDINSL
jgi:hypothetical protein